MELVLYKNFSKEVNSTKLPTNGTIMEVALKNETSIINPTFLIDGVDLDVNYCKWNNRFYFIDNIVLNNRNIYELICSIDVLATWKTSILNSRQYVLRSASRFDGYVSDYEYPTKTKQTVARSFPTSQFLTEPNQDIGPAPFQGTFIVGVAAPSDDGLQWGGVNYYNLTQPEAFFSELNSPLMIDHLDIESTELAEGIQKILFNPLQYIRTVMYFPFGISFSSVFVKSIKYGFWELTSQGVLASRRTDYIDTKSTNLNIPKHPQSESRGQYMNGSGFSNYVLKIQPFGEIVIDNNYLIDKVQLRLIMTTDITTGIAILRGYALSQAQADAGYSDAFVIANCEQCINIKSQVGIPVAINTMVADVANGVKNLVSNGVNLGGSIAAKNVSGIVSNTFGLLGDAFDALTPGISTIGACGALLYAFINSNIQLNAIFTEVVDDDPTQMGRPLCQYVTLSTLSGYCKTRDADIKLPTLRQETELIKSLLNGGFFIE